MRDMRFYPEAWPLHTAFVIARGSRTEARVVVVEIEQQGVRGTGECTPYPRYGESEESVMAQLAEMAPAIARGITREQLLTQMPAGAARNALDSALWDLECRLHGQSLWQRSGVTAPAQIRMAQTVSIGTPEAMAFAARELERQGATLLKIKLDDHYISERLVAIRAAVPQTTLIVDANESWQAEGLAARCQLLADLGVAMLEQPLPVTTPRWSTLFIRCRSAPMKAATPAPICRSWRSAIRWSTSNWTKPAA